MPSIRSQLFKTYFRQRNGRLAIDRPIEEQRKNLDRRGAQIPMARGTRATAVAAYGIYAEWIHGPETQPGRAFLYLHGGAYSLGSCASHRGFVSHIAKACRTPLFLPEYRLAPEHPFPAGLLDARAAYRNLLALGFPPHRIIVGGESAGGGLALALLATLRDEGLAMPAGAVLISPWIDLVGTGESLRTRARQDPWLRPQGIELVANRYRGHAPPDHPLVSPLYANLQGLPPLLIHVGDDEILLDDSTRLAARATAAAVDTDLKIWDGLWHVFHAFLKWAPEARRAIDEIGAWIDERMQTEPAGEASKQRAH